MGKQSEKHLSIFYYVHSTIGITTSMTTLHLGVSNRQFTANAPLKLLQLLSEGLRGYKHLTTKIWESQGFWFTELVIAWRKELQCRFEACLLNECKETET